MDIIKISNSVESIRKRNMLKNALVRLEDMYIKDPLTGVLNRFGMESYFNEIKRKSLFSRSKMYISFIDLDGLKHINDEYGHDEGDVIINAGASILKKATNKFKIVRYGGDEFIGIGTVRDEKEVITYWDKVNKEIDAFNQKRDASAKLSISYGYDIFKIDVDTTLEGCISIADKLMYEMKKKKYSD